MSSLTRSIRARYLLAGCLLAASVQASSASFTPGNIVIQSQMPGVSSYKITEYDIAGNLVQTLNLPALPEPHDPYSSPRDLAFDRNGQLYLYSGVWNPYLSVYNPTSNQWTHTTESTWRNNGHSDNGGIAIFGDRVFVTQARSGSSPSEWSKPGIYAFDMSDGSVAKFGPGSNILTAAGPVDLNLGLDGRLYSLTGYIVTTYDPVTLQTLAKISLPIVLTPTYRSIAADQYGNMFVTIGNEVRKYDKNGLLLQTFAVGEGMLDIDIRNDGLLSIGTSMGGVLLTDVNFSFKSRIGPTDSYGVHEWRSFATFVPSVPVPAAAWLFGSGLLGLAGLSRRRRLRSAAGAVRSGR